MSLPKKRLFSNHFQTPSYAIEPLLPYIDTAKTIWEPCCGKGNMVDAFKNKGYKVIGSDIEEDFLNTSGLECDVIVTNPPYSLKDKFIETCYNFNKPWAMLLPLTALEGLKRHNLYRKNGIEVILFDRRIKFETPSGKKSSPWFATAWFCWKFNLPNQLNFYKQKEK